MVRLTADTGVSVVSLWICCFSGKYAGEAMITADRAERYIHKASQWLKFIAGIALIAMMAVIGAHVLLRFFGKPIQGSYEVIQYFMVILLASGLAYTAAVRGNIAVSIVVRRLPLRVQASFNTITSFIGLIMFTVIAWHIVLYGMDLWRTGIVSSVLRIPYFQFIFLAAFGVITLCLVLLVEFCKSFLQVVGK